MSHPTEPAKLVWDPLNAVYGNGLPTDVSRPLFDRLAAIPWTPEQLPLVQGVWYAYQHAIDNFRYQLSEYRHDDVPGLCWACGKVFGAASALGGLMGTNNEKDFAIPAQVRKVADKYNV